MLCFKLILLIILSLLIIVESLSLAPSHFTNGDLYRRTNAESQPPIHLQPQKTTLWGQEGTWKELQCAVESVPGAKFIWEFKGELINDSDTFRISEENNLSILEVKVQRFSLGHYTCRAENEFGASERNFVLGCGLKPPIPIFDTVVVPNSGILIKITSFHNGHKNSLHIFDITGEEDVEEDELGESLPIKSYIIQIRVFRSCDEWTNVVAHSEKKFLRHGIVPGKIYRVRIASVTEAGQGEFSRPLTVHYGLSSDNTIDEDA